MAERHPAWVTGINDFEARLASGMLVASAGLNDQLDPIRARSGIRDTVNNPGRVTITGNRVLVNAFQAVIQDPARPAAGAYLVTLDAPKELSLPPANSTSSRIDLVVAEVTADTNPGFVVRVVEGQAGNPPQRPTLTNSLTLLLAEIQTPAGGTPGTPADLRQFTTSLGGILPARNAADRPARASNSQFLYRVDTKVLEVHTDGAWAPYRPPRGSTDTMHTVSFGSFPRPVTWGHYGNGYAPVGYTMTDDGWVRLRGLVKGVLSHSADSIVFTLPSPYQPAYRHLFTTYSSAGLARVDVTAAGVVILYTPGLAAGDWLSLDGIAYPAAATYAGSTTVVAQS